MREVAAEREKPALLFSGGKDSIVLVRLAQKAFAPGTRPVPAAAHRHRPQLPRGDRVPRPAGRRGRAAAARRLRAGVDRRRPRARGDRPARVAQPAADGHAAGRDRRARARRLLRRRPPRRGALPRQGARAVASATTSASGTRAASGPELWDLYNARVRRGENMRAFPISNWTELDVWQYIASEELELPPIYFAHDREVFARDGMLYAVSPFITLIDGEEPFTASVRYRTVGDMSCTGAVRSTAAHAARGRGRDRRDQHHRARRDARRRSRLRGRDGGPQARGLLLVDLLRLATAGSVDDGKSTLIGRLLYDAKAVLADQLAHVEERTRRRARPRAAHRRPARRARAGHHDRRRLPLVRHAAAALHPRRLPGPRAVHAQHGHRRLDRRPRAAAGRRPRRADRAVAPPRDDRRAAADPARDRRRQQDGPRRLRRGGASTTSCAQVLDLGAKVGLHEIEFIPISALEGRQRRRAARANMPWYAGPPLLERLETIPVEPPAVHGARLPVQLVLRGDGRRALGRGPARGGRAEGRRRGRRAAERHPHARRRGARRRRPGRGRSRRR